MKDEIPNFSKMKICLTEISTARRNFGLTFKITMNMVQKEIQFSTKKKEVKFVILTSRMKTFNFQSLNFTFKKELFISALNWRFSRKKNITWKKETFFDVKKVATHETVDIVQTCFSLYFESFLNNLDWESNPVDENAVLKNDAQIFQLSWNLC